MLTKTDSGNLLASERTLVINQRQSGKPDQRSRDSTGQHHNLVVLPGHNELDPQNLLPYFRNRRKALTSAGANPNRPTRRGKTHKALPRFLPVMLPILFPAALFFSRRGPPAAALNFHTPPVRDAHYSSSFSPLALLYPCWSSSSSRAVLLPGAFRRRFSGTEGQISAPLDRFPVPLRQERTSGPVPYTNHTYFTQLPRDTHSRTRLSFLPSSAILAFCGRPSD